MSNGRLLDILIAFGLVWSYGCLVWSFPIFFFVFLSSVSLPENVKEKINNTNFVCIVDKL